MLAPSSSVASAFTPARDECSESECPSLLPPQGAAGCVRHFQPNLNDVLCISGVVPLLCAAL